MSRVPTEQVAVQGRMLRPGRTLQPPRPSDINAARYLNRRVRSRRKGRCALELRVVRLLRAASVATRPACAMGLLVRALCLAT